MVFSIIQTYLGYITRISNKNYFGPKLVKIGQFFKLFSLFGVFSIYAETIFKVKDNQNIIFLIFSS